MTEPIRPTFAVTIAALRTADPRFPWVKPTPEEDDVAATLEVLEAAHQGDADEPDDRIHWGHCRECREWWPCPDWIEAEFLAVQYLGRAADRVTAHARAAWDDVQTKWSHPHDLTRPQCGQPGDHRRHLLRPLWHHRAPRRQPGRDARNG